QRALESGRLVEDDDGALAIRPALAAGDAKAEVARADVESAIVVDGADALDLEHPAGDEGRALGARAEPLGEEQLGRRQALGRASRRHQRAPAASSMRTISR